MRTDRNAKENLGRERRQKAPAKEREKDVAEVPAKEREKDVAKVEAEESLATRMERRRTTRMTKVFKRLRKCATVPYMPDEMEAAAAPDPQHPAPAPVDSKIKKKQEDTRSRGERIQGEEGKGQSSNKENRKQRQG